MARTPIVVTQLKKTVDPAYVAPALTTADDVNDHDWVLNAGDILVAFNTGAGAHEVKLIGTPDAQNRSADSTQSLAAGKLGIFGPLKTSAWIQSDGKCHMDTDDGASEVEFCILRGAV